MFYSVVLAVRPLHLEQKAHVKHRKKCPAQLFGWLGRWWFIFADPMFLHVYPLVNKQKAIENGYRNSWFTH